jgi:phage shock protein A
MDLRETLEDVEDQERRLQELRRQVAEVDFELSLYYSEAWPLFERRLQKIERDAIDALITGKDDADNRSKIKLVRHLLSIKRELEQERSRLQEQEEEWTYSG